MLLQLAPHLHIEACRYSVEPSTMGANLPFSGLRL